MPDPNPPGRPTKMHEVIHVADDGTQTTVQDRIVQSISVGNYVETAASLAGINKVTLFHWLKTGARTSASLIKNPTAEHTQFELDCLAFSNSVHEAQAQSEARDVAQLAQLARGGRKSKVTTTKTFADGTEEVTEREAVSEPNAAVLMWRLERRFPDRWGRQRVEITGAEGGPIEVVAGPRQALTELTAEVQARLESVPEAAHALESHEEGTDDA